MRSALRSGLLAALLAACAHAPVQPASARVATPSTPALLRVRVLPKLAPMETVVIQDAKLPILTFRMVFRSGSADDPPGKEGLTELTAEMMTQGGTQRLSSAELLRTLFPMAAELSVNSTPELTTFTGRVHRDHLDRFLEVFTDVMLEPRFPPADFERLRGDALNGLRNGLRGESDEELGKVALDSLLYPSPHPYRYPEVGTVEGLKSIRLEDVRAQWKRVFTQDRLLIGLAGPVDDALVVRVKARLAGLPATGAPAVTLPPAADVHGRVLIVEKKEADSVSQSLGYAYELRRGDPDYFAVKFATSYLGEHRQLNGLLFDELRERRGLNYGDYAYPEYFEQAGYGTFAVPNIGRTEEAFSLWIRPTEPQNALFATRAAMYFFTRLAKQGIPKDAFEVTRSFLRGYTLLWAQTDVRRLGYALDDRLNGTPDFLTAYRAALTSMTPEQVQAAVQKYLRPERMNFVYVAKDGATLARQLAQNAAAPVRYATPKPAPVVAEDVVIDHFKLPVDPTAIEVLDVSSFMER